MTDDSRGLVVLFKSITEKDATDDCYLSILKKNHYVGILVPTLSFQFKLKNLRECLLQPEKYSGMILTSQRSVESVNQAANNDLPYEWKNKRHYCVGMKTGETASKLLDLTILTGQDCGNAECLSALIIKDFQNENLPLPLLFPCSSLKMDTLPQALKENNISVDVVTSYVTIPHPQLQDSITQLVNKEPEYLIFFSPSGVNYALPFLREHNLVTNVKVISIGETTARALGEANVCVNRICAKPTPEDLIKTLNSFESK